MAGMLDGSNVSAVLAVYIQEMSVLLLGVPSR